MNHLQRLREPRIGKGRQHTAVHALGMHAMPQQQHHQHFEQPVHRDPVTEAVHERFLEQEIQSGAEAPELIERDDQAIRKADEQRIPGRSLEVDVRAHQIGARLRVRMQGVARWPCEQNQGRLRQHDGGCSRRPHLESARAQQVQMAARAVRVEGGLSAQRPREKQPGPDAQSIKQL